MTLLLQCMFTANKLVSLGEFLLFSFILRPSIIHLKMFLCLNEIFIINSNSSEYQVNSSATETHVKKKLISNSFKQKVQFLRLRNDSNVTCMKVIVILSQTSGLFSAIIYCESSNPGYENEKLTKATEMLMGVGLAGGGRWQEQGKEAELWLVYKNEFKK